jgi:hypothetical protein
MKIKRIKSDSELQVGHQYLAKICESHTHYTLLECKDYGDGIVLSDNHPESEGIFKYEEVFKLWHL